MANAGKKLVSRADGTRSFMDPDKLPLRSDEADSKRELWARGVRVPVPRYDYVKGERLIRAYAGSLNTYGNMATLEAQVRKDGWINSLTGIGDPSRDKRQIMNSTLALETLSQMDCEVIWRADAKAAKAIEVVPEELTRKGWDFQCEDDDDRSVTEAVMQWARDLDLTGKAKEALEYARAYGGAGIFLGADDGQRDLTKPLDLKKVKTFQWLNVLTPLELFPRIWYGDPHAPKYGEPMIYRIQRFVFGGAVESGFSEKIFEMPLVHESRIIRIDGIRVSRRHLRERNGWGDSVLMRVLQTISDFQQAHGAAAILTQDFAQAVFKIKDLAQMISSNDQGILEARAQIIELSRSIARAVFVDADGEDFERKSTSVQGLPDLIRLLVYNLASDLEMPVSRLMGEAPGGLGGATSGDTDIRWFYDRLESLQKRKLEPVLRRLLQVGLNCKTGPSGGNEPENWSIKFNPLWQLTDLEQADRRLKIAQADAAYIAAQVLSPEEVAASRFGGDEYNSETTIDLESRAKIQALDPEDPRPGPVDGVARPPPPPVPEGEFGAKEPNENAPPGSGAMGHKENPPNPGSTDEGGLT